MCGSERKAFNREAREEGPRKVAKAKRAASHWKTILGWPAETVMTYHDTLGTAFTSDAHAALEQAVKAVKQL